VISDMSFASEREWAQVIGERRFVEFRSTLTELVAHASPAEAGYTGQAERLEA